MSKALAILQFVLSVVGFAIKKVAESYGITLIYIVVLWGLLVTGLFLLLEDFWKAAGIVSAFSLYQITQSEFNREMMGQRNPEGNVKHAVQKQSKRN